MEYKIVIGGGWWCDGSGTHIGMKKESSNNTRKVDFFDLWYNSILLSKCDYIKMCIVDSNSPVKPDYKKYNNNKIEWISLDKNYLHGVVSNPKLILPGWDRSVILSAMYALMCDCTHYVYIEQDCLLNGENIIEYAINYLEEQHQKNNNIQVLLGDPQGTPQKLQQSLIILRKDIIAEFCQKMSTPENNSSEQKYFDRIKGKYTWFPFKGGRTRPINFNDKYFYIQHMTEQELEIMKKKLNY